MEMLFLVFPVWYHTIAERARVVALSFSVRVKDGLESENTGHKLSESSHISPSDKCTPHGTLEYSELSSTEMECVPTAYLISFYWHAKYISTSGEREETRALHVVSLGALLKSNEREHRNSQKHPNTFAQYALSMLHLTFQRSRKVCELASRSVEANSAVDTMKELSEGRQERTVRLAKVPSICNATDGPLLDISNGFPASFVHEAGFTTPTETKSGQCFRLPSHVHTPPCQDRNPNITSYSTENKRLVAIVGEHNHDLYLPSAETLDAKDVSSLYFVRLAPRYGCFDDF